MHFGHIFGQIDIIHPKPIIAHFHPWGDIAPPLDSGQNNCNQEALKGSITPCKKSHKNKIFDARLNTKQGRIVTPLPLEF